MKKFITLCITLFGISAHAVVVIDDMMSKQDMQKTGISKLTAAEKAALEVWLEDNFTPKQQKTVPLSLSENIDSGKRLRLTDGSLYAIAPDDTDKTALWITPFPLTITESGDAEYPYLITNQVSGSKVKAKRLEPPSS